jgi:hypothetical protein
LPSFEIVTEDDRLGEIATNLLMEDSHEPKLLITNRFRWAKASLEGNKYVQRNHMEFEKYLKKIGLKYGGEIYKAYNAKVILLRNPVSKKASNKEAIKILLRSGADVRFYKKRDIDYRLIMLGKKVFFTFSDSDKDDVVVNRGFLYQGESQGADTFIEYFKMEFDRAFGDSKRIALNEKGEIVFADSGFSRLSSSLKEISYKDYILIILGALFGVFLETFFGA